MLSKYFAADLFRNKTVFVTGGAGTINFGIAKGFAELGARLSLCGRTIDKLEAAAKTLRGLGAAKAGIDSLMRGLALEWGKHGIRCNSVLPGPIEKTEGLSRLLTAQDIEELKTYVPLGRFGTIEDVVAVCCFLASPLASLLTG